jgi:hypothetical protein
MLNTLAYCGDPKMYHNIGPKSVSGRGELAVNGRIDFRVVLGESVAPRGGIGSDEKRQKLSVDDILHFRGHNSSGIVVDVVVTERRLGLGYQVCDPEVRVIRSFYIVIATPARHGKLESFSIIFKLF